MFGKILKGTAKFAVGVVIDTALDSENDSDEEQLDMLGDGLGGIQADGDSMTRSEAEDAQSRGELYDTYY
ncbi:hypothetical protein [Alteromonas halophila]|uniref:Uncharacterized protein n=1 Tax=Alteromonas halophila TaxID=516698 RepID=A0A918JR93_9ALTE|nr:hypothetical protein [Alteromonas halophila]GGW96681.1 hypothetical protein GCM10007391_33510 [Alteromonas halophila]